MSDTSQRILEVKIRPYANNSQERPDQKTSSRVHFCRDALLDLKIESGQTIYLWKAGDAPVPKREAIAWLTVEKSLSKKVVQVSKSFQEACGFKLGDDLYVARKGDLERLKGCVLRDVGAEEEGRVLGEKEREYWEWFLRESLSRAEVVFAGMTFKNLSLRGPKRTFVVDFVNGSPASQGRYEETSIVKIASAIYATAESQAIGTRAQLQVVDVAGIDQALKKLNRFLNDFDRKLKFTFPKRSCAVLLHGGHGTGKSFLIEKVISTGWGRVFRIDKATKPTVIPSIFKDAKLCQPSIIVLDEFETLVSKEDSISEETARVLGLELDNLVDGVSDSLPRVLVIAATLDIGNIPLSLRKRGRLSTDIPLLVPDAPARKAILKSLSVPIHPDKQVETLDRLGDRTHAYTAEDLLSLLDTACSISEEKVGPKEGETEPVPYYLEQDDIEQALLLVRPTAMHDITLRPPSVKWDEIGGQESVKKALRRAVETPLLYPDRMARLGASPKKGLLLYGPPGCSKTLSAQAMATESSFNFFAVKGAELLNMYVGESERAVRNIFSRARAAAPSIIFFDEIESIGSKREGGRNVGINVLTTLLNEMDGIESLKGVTVLAATNQPENLDLALIRPGRFDSLIYVPPPDLAGREAIFRVRARKIDLAEGVDIKRLAEITDGYSGAEISGICQNACEEVMQRCEETGKEEQVCMGDLVRAVEGQRKGIRPEMIERFERWGRESRGGV